MNADLRSEPETVFTGKADVAQRHGRRFGQRLLQPFFGRARLDHRRAALALDPRAKERTHRLFVINDQHTRRHRPIQSKRLLGINRHNVRKAQISPRLHQ
jgi:hypothetical protein